MSIEPNINPDEVKKFDELAQRWWEAEGPMQALHQLNPLRSAFIEKHCPLLGSSVLDIGCGGGILSEALARSGALVTAIDLSPHALAVAKEHAEQQALHIDYQLIASADFKPPHAFDVVTCMELLEHVPNPAELIQDCTRLVKPGGLVFFSTLNRSLKSYALAILGAEYILNLLPRGTHTYAQFIRPSELRQWAAQTHLSLVDLQGIRYHPLSQSFSLSADVAVNYMMCFHHEN